MKIVCQKAMEEVRCFDMDIGEEGWYATAFCYINSSIGKWVHRTGSRDSAIKELNRNLRGHYTLAIGMNR